MKCKEVKELLPEYMAEICSDDEKKELEKHLGECEECKREYERVSSTHGKNNESYEEISNKIKKVKNKFNFKILRICIGTILVSYILFNFLSPNLLQIIRVNDSQKVQRAIVDFYQFTSNNEVVGAGNNIGKYSRNFKIFVRNSIGTKSSNSRSIDFNYDLINNQIKCEYWNDSSIVHPNIKPEKSFENTHRVETAKKILKKNGDDTVARINLSFKGLISYEETVKLLDKYDINIIKMSIESGNEDKKSKNISYAANQYFSFALSGTMLDTSQSIFKLVKLNKDNTHEYKNLFLEELKFLNENKKYIVPDEIRKLAGYSESVLDDEAEYILENGIKIYGLRITGPSEELNKLLDEINPKYAEVEEVDFWYWDK